MNQNYELILKTVLINKTEEEIAHIAELLKFKIDWCEIIGQVINHRLGGYFYNGLTSLQRSKLPKEFSAILKLIIDAQERQLKEKYDEFMKVSAALEAVNIRYCGLKGLVFCADFYTLGDRRSNDVDIMVHEDDLGELDDVLRSLGYIQSFRQNGKMEEASRQVKLMQRMNYHDLVPYVKELEDCAIELDINFKFDSAKHVIDDQIFKYGTKVYEANGYRIRGLPFYTNLIFLCIHFHREATNTIWTRGKRDISLYKIVDIINCIRAHKDEFNIDEWCELVEKLGVSKKCYYTFATLSEFYEDEMLKQVKDKLEPEDLSFMKEIVVEGRNKVIERTDSFFNSAFGWAE